MRKFLVTAVALLALAGCGAGGGGRAATQVSTTPATEQVSTSSASTAPSTVATRPVSVTEPAPAVASLADWKAEMLPLSQQLTTGFQSLADAAGAQDFDKIRTVSAQGIATATQMRVVAAQCPDQELGATFDASLVREESGFNHYIAAADAFQGGDIQSATIEMRSGTSDLGVGSALMGQATARLHDLNSR